MSIHVHPAVKAVREFERDSDAIERRCTALAHQLLSGELSEDEFDAVAFEILGADYEVACDPSIGVELDYRLDAGLIGGWS